ncbi:hypothetical protein GGR50DRAFT_376888 [Xylaria sp. CBS 124048]|nr:hypothetical protein GGR50DRAFT_376888 [Xylaria sp. CBS 124048]
MDGRQYSGQCRTDGPKEWNVLEGAHFDELSVPMKPVTDVAVGLIYEAFFLLSGFPDVFFFSLLLFFPFVVVVVVVVIVVIVGPFVYLFCFVLFCFVLFGCNSGLPSCHHTLLGRVGPRTRQPANVRDSSTVTFSLIPIFFPYKPDPNSFVVR